MDKRRGGDSLNLLMNEWSVEELIVANSLFRLNKAKSYLVLGVSNTIKRRCKTYNNPQD